MIPGAEIVGSAADGAKDVQLADDLRPDVVVTDLLMPRMDGFEATKRIAATVPDARVLVVSSSTDPKDVERAGEAGRPATCRRTERSRSCPARSGGSAPRSGGR